MTTILTTSLETFCPTLDVSQISMSEALDLCQIMGSFSDLLNAALVGRSPAMVTYLDDWQALAFAACSNLADIVHAMHPHDPLEQASRNHLLATMRLRVAEGRVVVTGPDMPEMWAEGEGE